MTESVLPHSWIGTEREGRKLMVCSVCEAVRWTQRGSLPCPGPAAPEGEDAGDGV